MTLKELLYRKSFKNVFNVIYKNYLKGKSDDEVIRYSINFSKAFEELKSLKSNKKTKNSIVLNEINESDQNFVDVCYFDSKDDEHYGLDFMDWSEILQCEVIAPKKFNQTTIVAHILWEITFWGYSRDKIKEQALSLHQSAEEIIEHIKDIDIEDTK